MTVSLMSWMCRCCCGALDAHRGVQRLGRGAVVFHIVREYHGLGEIDEAAEFRVLKAGVRAVALCENTVAVVRLLDLGR